MSLVPALRAEMLEPPRGPVRAVLDTDTYNEIDDQFALVHALLAPERIRLEAIYAAPFQNSRARDPGHGMELSHDEILRLLERMDHAPQGLVHRGVTEYVGPTRQARRAPAVDDLVARARTASAESPLYVLAIAAISNVASAILAAPDIVERIVVVWLGGHALHWPDTREFNLRQDVGGAQAVLDSGVPLVLVPCLGVTSHLHSSLPEIERHVEPCGRIGAFLAERFRAYAADPLGWSKELWDMAATGWLIEPDWAPSALIPAPILTDSLTWSTDPRRHAIRYVMQVRRNPLLRDFFMRLAAHAGRPAAGGR